MARIQGQYLKILCPFLLFLLPSFIWGQTGTQPRQVEAVDTISTGDTLATYEDYIMVSELDTIGIDDYRYHHRRLAHELFIKDDSVCYQLLESGDTVCVKIDTIQVIYGDPTDTSYYFQVQVNGGTIDSITHMELIQINNGTGINVTYNGTAITIASTVTDTDTYIDSVRQITAGVLDSIWLYRNDLSDSLLIVLNDSVGAGGGGSDTYIDSVRQENDGGSLDSVWFYRNDLSDSLLVTLVGDSLGTPFPRGQIIYGDSTRRGQSDSLLFWNDTSYMLGIGTNSPIAKVHISDSATNSENRPSLLLDAIGSNFLKIIEFATISGIWYDKDHPIFFIPADSINQLSLIPGRVVTIDSGYVGIGTSIPSTKLHTVGDVRLQGLYGAGALDSLLYVDASDIVGKIHPDDLGITGGSDDQQVDNFSIGSNILTLEIEDDGQAPHTVDLSPYLDNTTIPDTYIDSAAYDNVIDSLTLYRDSSGVTIDSFKVLIETDTFRLDYDSTTALLSYSGQVDSPLVVLPWKDAGADDYSANYFKDSIRHDGYVGIWTVPEAPLHVVDPAYPTPGADTFGTTVAIFEGLSGSSNVILRNYLGIDWNIISHAASAFMINNGPSGTPIVQIDTGATDHSLRIYTGGQGWHMADYGQGILQDTFSYIAGWRADGDLVEISMQDIRDSLNQISPLQDHDWYQIETTTPTGSIDSMIYTNQSVVLNKDTALCEGCELVIHPRTFDNDVLPTMRMIQHDSTVWGEMSVWDTDGVPFMSFVNSKATSGYTAFSYRETDGSTPFSILGTAPEGSLQIRSDGQMRRIPYGSGTFGPSIHPVNYITAVDTNGFVVELDWSEVSDTLANYLGADSTVHRDFDFILLPLNDTLGTNIDSLNPDDSTDLYALIWHGGQVRIGETPYQIRYDTTQGGVDATAALQIMGQNDAIDIYHDSLPTIWIRNNKGDAQIRYSDNEMEHDTTPSFLEFGFINWQDTATMGTMGDTTLRHPFRVSSHANTGALEVYQDSILLGDYVEADTTITSTDLLGSGIFVSSPNGKIRLVTADTLNALQNVIASAPQEIDTFALNNDSLVLDLTNTTGGLKYVDFSKYVNPEVTISNDTLYVGDSVLILPQGADSSGVVIPTGEIYFGQNTRAPDSSPNLTYGSNYLTISQTSAVNMGLDIDAGSAADAFIFFRNPSRDWAFRTSGPSFLIRDVTGGTNPIQVLGGNLVGINTTPSSTLHVDGDVRLENLSGGTPTQMVWADDNGKLRFVAPSTFDDYNGWVLSNGGAGNWTIGSGESVEFLAGSGLSVTVTDGTVSYSASGGDEYVDGVSFNTGNGILTLTRDVGSNLTVDLDGRYLTSEVDGSTTNEIQSIDVWSINNESQVLSLSLSGIGTSTVDLTSTIQDVIDEYGGGGDDDMGATVTANRVIYGLGTALPGNEAAFTYNPSTNTLNVDAAVIDGDASGFVSYGNSGATDAYLQVQDDGDIALFSGGTAQRIFFDGPKVYSSSGILFGIGRDPATNNLEVGGTASKTAAGDWLANSDERLKQNITQLSGEDLLQNLLKIRGVEYEWKPGGQDYDERPQGPQYGLIAQDIQEAFPRDQFVNEDNNGYLQASYGTYDPIYIEVIRHLDDRIKKLESQIENLKQK